MGSMAAMAAGCLVCNAIYAAYIINSSHQPQSAPNDQLEEEARRLFLPLPRRLPNRNRVNSPPLVIAAKSVPRELISASSPSERVGKQLSVPITVASESVIMMVGELPVYAFKGEEGIPPERRIYIEEGRPPDEACSSAQEGQPLLQTFAAAEACLTKEAFAAFIQ